ncbi:MULTISPECIES: hypothetical protein [unclassified Flavobacterium]|uniref:hypothetical protein n=1 Tax=unclassified Flavobacterium TaxID=196869 RepID=UPI0010493CBF|nr:MULTISPECIES: hypothetical protein [unclassified Flavobacterium]
MKETIEFRINYDFAHLLFKEDEGKNVGTSVRVVEISKSDPRYNQIPIISKQVKENYDRGFFFGWKIKRKYSINEIKSASLFYLKIKNVFQPAGEECGTIYDETEACDICGANRKQIGPLKLKRNSIPKKDISKTISGEIVVSEKFAIALKSRNLQGVILNPVFLNEKESNYFQLNANNKLQLSEKTIAGNDPFETTSGDEGGSYDISGYKINMKKEVYKCPKGHLIGLNILSEVYVLNNPSIYNTDFFTSVQKAGVKRGLLEPEPIYFCSKDFKKMTDEEKLTGFDFEVAHIVM